MGFHDADILDSLDSATPEELDELPFGVVRMDGESIVTGFNRTESDLSGLRTDRVLGRHFFEQVAPCTNNYLVALRYAEETLDDEIDYVFTYRMKPTKVRLRLIKSPASRWQYLLVERI